MKYKESGFRALYKQYSVYPMNDKVKSLVDGVKGMEEATGVLVYGYYDREEGLMLEVLAAANLKEESVTFEMPVSTKRTSVKARELAEVEFSHIDDVDSFLSNRYADKLTVLKGYDVSAKLEATRNLAFLDPLRDEFSFDDIKVIFKRDGKDDEECYVRIEEQVEGYFVGTLVIEPFQNFGYQAGDKIAFFVGKNEDESISCYANLNPSAVLTEDELEDGLLLEEAVVKFNSTRKEADLIELLEVLRDSYVWVPCKPVSELPAKNGETSGSVPELIKKGENYFIPMFSSQRVMDEYSDNYKTLVPLHVTKVISMLNESRIPLTGIVLNVFTSPFVIDKDLSKVIEKMKTRIEE